MLDPNIQLASRRRPHGEAAMLQTWTDLAFLHFAVEPSLIQATLPKGLSVDTFPDEAGEERAWIGLVAFSMEKIRPVAFPALPWISKFLETNVRTYVHRNGQEPGVYFYSLDAQRRLACDFARLAFGLNYLHSDMTMAHSESSIRYRIRRYDEPQADLDLRFNVGNETIVPTSGSLEFFLIERYLLYSLRNGRLGTGRVWHEPYALRSMSLLQLQESLCASIDLPERPFTHSLFSPGVDVEVFPFTPLD